MNNAIALVMLSLMGAYAVYFLIKTNQNTKTEQNNNIPLHIIIGMIIGAILGWFIGLYLYGLIKTKGEGDAFYVLISSLFFSVLGGLGALFISSKLMKRDHNKLISRDRVKRSP